MQHLETNQASTSASQPPHVLHSVIMVEVYLEALFPGTETGVGGGGGGKGRGWAILGFPVEPLIF